MSKLEEVEALLRGEQPDEREPQGIPAEPEDAPDPEPTGEDESAQVQEAQAKPAELKVGDIADKLGLSKSEVYELLKVKLPGGQEYTLANLKDMAAQSHQQQERYNKDYNTLMREREDIKGFAEFMSQYDPKAKDQYLAEKAKSQEAEMRDFLAVVPGWESPEVRQRETDKMLEKAREYGVRDLAQLNRDVTKAWVMKMLRDVATASPLKAQPAPRSTAPRRQEPIGSTKQDKLSAISRLIGA